MQAEHPLETRNPVRQAVKQLMIRALPRRVFAIRGAATSQSVYLTFDDGPHPEHTGAVLDALKASGAKATFFVVGERAASHPELCQRIVDEGHALGHHSYYHTEPATTTAEQLASESERTQALLARCVGKAPRLFRPPHGKITAGKLFHLWRQGQTVVLWNVDPKDYAAESETPIVDWFDRHPPEAGDIVLMHDNHAQSARALPAVLERIARRGLSAKALSPDDFAS